MATATHCCENEEKIAHILEAAQKRFGLYGLGKTTMQEIASDLGTSKGSLYYYFPDKGHLFRAVVEKEQSLFLSFVEDKIRELTDAEMMLKAYVKIRQTYFRTFLNLSRFRLEDIREIKPLMEETWADFEKKEKVIIRKIFSKGIRDGIFSISELERTVSLFLHLMKGLHHRKTKNKGIFYLEPEEYASLIKDDNLFTEIFIKGLKYK
jgi:AcrR family transcriptional regulator